MDAEARRPTGQPPALTDFATRASAALCRGASRPPYTHGFLIRTHLTATTHPHTPTRLPLAPADPHQIPRLLQTPSMLPQSSPVSAIALRRRRAPTHDAPSRRQ